MKKYIAIACLTFFVWLTACTISYKFNGASIDYTVVKSISVHDFPNQAANVYLPLSQMMTESIRDIYTRQTRLQVISENGDMDVEGEITDYVISHLAVTDEMRASQTRLTITVRVRFMNTKNSEEDFEQSFSAYREFDSQRMIDDVQEELCQQIVKELTEQIYNATVANW
jgi:hypothetical protein